MELFLVLGLLVASTSAIRGIWSPCGLSMLSSITPMTEAGRGNRFSVTARWFVAGGLVGGLSLGLVAAIGAAAVSLADLGIEVRWALAALVGFATAAIDLGAFGVKLPIFKRQVDDGWLRTYRGRVYGAGFGWQIGFGVATYIMTAGVFLTIAIAVLGAAPLLAIALGGAFGLVRGSAVYLGRSAITPAALSAVHARLDHLGPTARLAALVIQLLAAVVFAAAAWGVAPGVFATLVAVVAVTISARSLRSTLHA